MAGLAFAGAIAAQPTLPDDGSRGRLLYATHCIACHNTQVHWRARRLARDWTTLRAQVRDWQRQGGLAWPDGDIADVARYLNALYYHFEPDGETLSLSAVFP